MINRLDFWTKAIGVLETIKRAGLLGYTGKSVHNGVADAVLTELAAQKEVVDKNLFEDLSNKENLFRKNFYLLIVDGHNIVLDRDFELRAFRNDLTRYLDAGLTLLKSYDLIGEKKARVKSRTPKYMAARNIEERIREGMSSTPCRTYVSKYLQALDTQLRISSDVWSTYFNFDQNRKEHLKVATIASFHFAKYDIPFLLIPKP